MIRNIRYLVWEILQEEFRKRKVRNLLIGEQRRMPDRACEHELEREQAIRTIGRMSFRLMSSRRHEWRI